MKIYHWIITLAWGSQYANVDGTFAVAKGDTRKGAYAKIRENAIAEVRTRTVIPDGIDIATTFFSMERNEL